MTGVHVESVGRGRPLVMLHGWAMHSGLWAPLLPRLIGRYRMHLVDLPGHGHSDPLEAPSSLSCVVQAVRDAIGPVSQQPLTVLGWSWGGQIALEWARMDPRDVEALVLMSTTPSFVRRQDFACAMDETSLRRFGDELRVAYRPTLKRFVALQMHGSERARETIAALRAPLFDRGEASPQALSDALELLASTDLRPTLSAIDQPTLVIAGDRDTLAPLAGAEWLAAALPRATLALIAGAAHAPFLSHPDAVVAALDAFVANAVP